MAFCKTMIRDSEKGLGFLMAYEAPETKAQRIKEVGDRIKRMNRHSYRDISAADDPLNLDTPVFTSTPTVAPQETPKKKPGKYYKNLIAQKWITRPKAKPMEVVDYVNTMNHLYSNEPEPTNQRTIEQLTALKNWSQGEADNINKIKKMAWEESPTKSPQPKKITPQDVINVYKTKESNQRKKNESTTKIKQGGKGG